MPYFVCVNHRKETLFVQVRPVDKLAQRKGPGVKA